MDTFQILVHIPADLGRFTDSDTKEVSFPRETNISHTQLGCLSPGDKHFSHTAGGGGDKQFVSRRGGGNKQFFYTLGTKFYLE